MFPLPFLVSLDWDPFSVGHLLSGGEKPSTVAFLVQVTFVSCACLFSLITKLNSPAVAGRAGSSSRQSAPTPDPVWLLCRPSRTPASFRTQHRQGNAQLKSESSDEVVGGLIPASRAGKKPWAWVSAGTCVCLLFAIVCGGWGFISLSLLTLALLKDKLSHIHLFYLFEQKSIWIRK